MKQEELKKMIQEEIKQVLAEGELSDRAQKMYNQLSNAIFVCIQDKTLKKEFHKQLTNLQKDIEKFVFKSNIEG